MERAMLIHMHIIRHKATLYGIDVIMWLKRMISSSEIEVNSVYAFDWHNLHSPGWISEIFSLLLLENSTHDIYAYCTNSSDVTTHLHWGWLIILSRRCCHGSYAWICLQDALTHAGCSLYRNQINFDIHRIHIGNDGSIVLKRLLENFEHRWGKESISNFPFNWQSPWLHWWKINVLCIRPPAYS